jgi:hypothetical protein
MRVLLITKMRMAAVDQFLIEALFYSRSSFFYSKYRIHDLSGWVIEDLLET